MVAGSLSKFKRREKDSDGWAKKGKPCMEERIKDLLEKVQRTAEIILEHHTSKAFKDNIITLGAESIITMCKEAINEVEKEQKEG
jgi:sugar-specific transcriptional regulator TrmB